MLTPRMIAGYSAGTLTSYVIADRLGVSQPTVLKMLREAGVNTSRNPTQRPRTVIPPTLIRLYRRRDIGIQDVAESVGCSYGGARKALLRAGVKLHPKTAINAAGKASLAPVQLAKLLRWLQPRYSNATLAAVIGVPARSITAMRM